MNKYRFCYSVYRFDSDAKEIAEDYSVELYPATASPMGEEGYQVEHEFTAKDDEDAIKQMKEIKKLSFNDDFFVFSLYQGDRVVRTEEDEENEQAASELCCMKCGQAMVVNEDGTTNHLKAGSEGVGGLTDTDHDQDADHAALDPNG